MRLALAALLLGLACTALHAQPMEKKKTEEKKKALKADSARSERDRNRDRDRGPRSERHREHKPPATGRDQRGREPPRSDPPTIKMDRAHPSQTRPRPTTPPSPAEQQQREMEQQRRLQQGQPSDSRQTVIQCSARPVCGGGGYGRCSSVEQTYRGGTEQSRRQNMISECIAANTPDSCNCAAQCRRVAQCSIF